MGRHTILLVQTRGLSTRSYYDFDNEAAAITTLIGMFEQRLFELNPNQPLLSYEPRDVLAFIDSMPHIGLLIYDDRQRAYTPFTKDNIKQRTQKELQQRAR
ncbi:hypothetical protein Rsub_01899 [Raphidocelis subcapitata]|uniref:Enhancer of rudimentary homolog n=1 Tax=Raphidocelis subcapitata TaxID=307507 RepID=A0A2V0NRB3_9CHLO|nr:hypothetical protein Rsub_01899 [Raphidocelis subcapitata]|eukprot:GBF89182.1 hypothetical protein Rsub_01899 [Raphidocelis subcapitata]